MLRTCKFRHLMIAILVVASLQAVGIAGSIVGTVRDPSKGLVAGVDILVRNQNTGAERTTETTRFGEYAVPLLPPGLYSVTAVKMGFRSAERLNIKLDVEQTARIDFALELGPVIEEIEVMSAAPLVEADISSLGQVVDQQKVANLPLNERNFLSFTLLVPGAQLPAEGSENARQGGAISVNGAREKSNNFLLDGVDNNDPTLNQYSVLPPIDAIQEFKVQSANSSAEFGRSGGAQINMILKGGTNDLHGSLFEFVRNRHLDAKNFFDRPDCTPGAAAGSCAEIPRFDRNQFGGSLGGPIAANRAFFFIAYEGLRLREANTRLSTVPSVLQREAALDAVPAGERNPAGEALLNLYPLANVGPDLAASNDLLAAPVIRNTIDQIVLRADHHASSKDILSGHYVLYEVDRFDPFLVRAFTDLPGFGVSRSSRGQSARFAWNRVIGPRLINEARFGLNRLETSLIPEDNGRNISEELGFPSFSSDSFLWGTPNVIVSGFENVGAIPIMPQTRAPTTLHWIDNMAWTPGFWGGRHQFKFGTDIRYIRTETFRPVFPRGNWVFTGRFTRSSLQDLLRGLPTVAVVGRGDATLDLRSTAVNLYFQDDIRIGSNLTLNLGVRWDYSSPPVETQDRLSTADFGSNSVTCQGKPDCQFLVAGTDGIPRGLFDKDWNNFAPRVGLAWRPLGGSRFVIRSAYGIFYDVATTSHNPENPPFLTQTVFPNLTGGATIQTIAEPGGPTPPVQGRVRSRDLQTPYLQHWQFNVQYEALTGLLIDLAYVGSKGTKLGQERNINQPPPMGRRPFPQFADIAFRESRANSSYHALQLRVEKRLSHGLTFLGAYTWSRSIDDASTEFDLARNQTFIAQNSHDLAADRGLSGFHAKHRLVWSYLYELPLGRGRRWLQSGALRHLLNDWRLGGILTLQTGQPFTVNRLVDQSRTGIAEPLGRVDRPDQIADPFQDGPVLHHPEPGCHSTVSQGGRAADLVKDPTSWFNPCAFASPPVPRFGNAGRNSVIGPGLANLDFSLLKEVLFSEGRRLQLRFEFFNLTNHPNFDLPDRIFDSSTFSRVRSSNLTGLKPPRQIQFGVKYLF